MKAARAFAVPTFSTNKGSFEFLLTAGVVMWVVSLRMVLTELTSAPQGVKQFPHMPIYVADTYLCPRLTLNGIT